MRIQDYKQHVQSGGDFMKLQQGENKVRLVSEFEQFQDSYQGKPTQRFMCYVIDRKDGKVKPMTVGASIFSRVGELSLSTEYGFTTNLPPYDVIIGKTGQDLATEYTVHPARTNTDLTEEEKAEVAKLKPVTEIIQKMLAKKGVAVQPEDDGIPIIEQEEPETVGPLPF